MAGPSQPSDSKGTGMRQLDDRGRSMVILATSLIGLLSLIFAYQGLKQPPEWASGYKVGAWTFGASAAWFSWFAILYEVPAKIVKAFRDFQAGPEPPEGQAPGVDGGGGSRSRPSVAPPGWVVGLMSSVIDFAQPTSDTFGRQVYCGTAVIFVGLVGMVVLTGGLRSPFLSYIAAYAVVGQFLVERSGNGAYRMTLASAVAALVLLVFFDGYAAPHVIDATVTPWYKMRFVVMGVNILVVAMGYAASVQRAVSPTRRLAIEEHAG